MDFFGVDFENQQSKDTLKEIVDTISAYDIYDFISRIAGLNLMSENQNKSVLLDSLVQYILEREKFTYKSNAKMSASKFKRVINELNNTFLSASVDPCENTFIQNVMFAGKNYRVFNGIDSTPAYNLQALVRILFQYQNDYSTEFLERCSRLLAFVLGISEDKARVLSLNFTDIKYDEQHMVILPSSDRIQYYSDLVKLPLSRVCAFINGYFDISELAINFGNHEVGNIDNRLFYAKPFLIDDEKDQLIILNISLLPMFAFYKIIEWSGLFGIKEKVLSRYNDYLWVEAKKTLDALGHKKIDEKALGLNCVVNDYYKEMIVTVYNNQLMLVVFICDDGYKYPEAGMHVKYPDERHNELFQNRLQYFEDNIKSLEIPKEDWFSLIILCGFGRGIGVGGKDYTFAHRPMHLNPFELHCISIKERNTAGFFPRYMRAKSQLNTWESGMMSELNSVCIYTSNNYSFYISDDLNPYEMSMYIAPGDSIDYITEALVEENRKLVDSYVDGEKTEVIYADRLRNIYVEDSLFRNKDVAFYILFENVGIWIKTEEITKYDQLNVYFSVLDVISYWLSECKDIIEQFCLPYDYYVIQISLFDNIKEYYYERKDVKPFEESILSEISNNSIILKWKPEAFGNMNQTSNVQEKALCLYLLDIFNRLSIERLSYEKRVDGIFANPLKKRFYSFDYHNKPYLKPVEMGNKRRVHGEDEDYLAGLIGKELLESGRWSIGIVPDEKRNLVTHEVVSWLYNRLVNMIAMFSSENILEVIYFDLEDTLHNLILAERRFYSEIACYPEKEDKFIEEYNSLNRTSLSLKFLAEYITACPPKGTKHFGVGQYEELLAICSMIIDWAYKGDLFTYGIINTPIEFLVSRRIGLKKEEFIDMYTYGDVYRRRQLKYNSSRMIRPEYYMKVKDYSESLETAFEMEFGYKYSEFINVVATMVEFNKEDVICIEEDKVVESLVSLNGTLNVNLVSKVLEDITYRPRADYLKLPSKYKSWEAYPWRFNRRYSFNRRPVLQRDTKLIWGNRQLYHMLEYVNNLIDTGKFKADSAELKALIGKISDDRGDAFNKMIIEIINDFDEFEIYPNVKKINGKKIINNEGNDLGDIDILIIDKKTNRLIASEVKDFHFSRNPYEIQQEYIKMFVDKKKEKCFATKHQRRVEWLREHLEDVKQEYNLDNLDWIIDGIFIVSEPLISSYIYKQTIKCISRVELSPEAIRDL